jgi:hypothetical protein
MLQFTNEHVGGTHVHVNKKLNMYLSSRGDEWNLDGGIVPPFTHPS